MVGLEAFDRQVYAVHQVVVWRGFLKFQLRLDLARLFVQGGQLFFESGTLRSSCSRKLFRRSCNSRAGIGYSPSMAWQAMDLGDVAKVLACLQGNLPAGDLHDPRQGCCIRVFHPCAGAGDVHQAGVQRFQMVDHRVHAQAE